MTFPSLSLVVINFCERIKLEGIVVHVIAFLEEMNNEFCHYRGATSVMDVNGGSRNEQRQVGWSCSITVK